MESMQTSVSTSALVRLPRANGHHEPTRPAWYKQAKAQPRAYLCKSLKTPNKWRTKISHRIWSTGIRSRIFPPSRYSTGRSLRGKKRRNCWRPRLDGWRVPDGGSKVTDGGWRRLDDVWTVTDGGWRGTDSSLTTTTAVSRGSTKKHTWACRRTALYLYNLYNGAIFAAVIELPHAQRDPPVCEHVMPWRPSSARWVVMPTSTPHLKSAVVAGIRGGTSGCTP